MSRILLRSIAITSLSAAALWAADFWESKSYTEWSKKEVGKLMTNSPWAQKVTVYMSGGRGGGGFGGGGGRPRTRGSDRPTPPAGGGGFGDGPFGLRLPGGGGGVLGGPGGGAGPAPSMNVIVRWFSSIPVKQAMVRSNYGAEAATTQEAIEYLARQETHYIVAVAGLPERMAGFVQRNPDALKENTMLKRKKKEPINPDDVQTQERTANFYFMFPKTDAITVDDKEVEFIMKTQRFEVKRKFKLKNMVFNGELSL